MNRYEISSIERQQSCYIVSYHVIVQQRKW